jgi:hypothetical protein
VRKSNITEEQMMHALNLRLAGSTYPKISKTLGISVDWCKRNLKDVVTIQSIESIIRSDISALALRPEGATFDECVQVFRKHGIESRQDYKRSYYDIYSKVKKSLMRGDENHLFRREWMRSDNPRKSYKIISKIALEVMNCIGDCTDEFMNEIYPDCYDDQIIRNSIKYELKALVFGTPQGFNYNEWLDDQAEKLANRVQGNEKETLERPQCSMSNEDFTGIELCPF